MPSAMVPPADHKEGEAWLTPAEHLVLKVARTLSRAHLRQVGAPSGASLEAWWRALTPYEHEQWCRRAIAALQAVDDWFFAQGPHVLLDLIMGERALAPRGATVLINPPGADY